MDYYRLLDAVQDSDGYYCVIGIKGKNDVRQKVVPTREDFDKQVKKLLADNRNVFFGVAKYKTDEGRKKTNVKSLKAFWVDIDCGPTKAVIDADTGRPEGYANQAIGLKTLKSFCQRNKLPTPTLVNSGGGIHAYWPLTESITPEEWEKTAYKLRKLCEEQDFYIDESVFETARVLRVPGTLNFKFDPPRKVTLLHSASAVEHSEFDALLPNVLLPEKKKKRELTALGKSMLDNIESRFGTIIIRSAKGDGCAQLFSCYKNRATLSEPRWFNALSIAKFCSDKDKAVHKISEGHPDYDPAVVEQKITGIKGPHSCAEFEKNNPGGCEGCPHRDKITSPIVLGKELRKATTSIIEEESEDGAPPVKYKVPAYPSNFYRGKSGGVWIDSKDGPVLVYQHDLYIVKQMHDPVYGFVSVFRAHLPKDGVREFIIPNAAVVDKRELRKTLAMNGVTVSSEKQFTLLMNFVTDFINDLQYKRKAELMRTRFGWWDNCTVFVAGSREITKDGVYHSPPSSITEDIAEYMIKKGSLDKWKEVFKLYGRPGLELHAFGAMTGFGAPLLEFTEHKGAIINFIHTKGGTGKTTILRMANSVFGDPEMLLGNPQDTEKGRTLKLGVLGNIVNTIDEMTNTTPAAFSRIAYACSQGRAHDKANSRGEKLARNTARWRTITLASSNSSFYEKLTTHKNTPDGELVRLLEFKIDYTDQAIISTEEGRQYFDSQLNHNYGMAGEIYIQYVITHIEEVKRMISRLKLRIDTDCGFRSRERNWTSTVAANLAGGFVAKTLGLIDWDMKRIYAAVVAQLKEIKEDTNPPVGGVSEVIGNFINNHRNCLLAVDDDVDGRSAAKKFPVIEPTGPLLMRYEPNTRLLFIAVNAVRKDCVDQQVNYTDTVKEMKAKGALLDTVNKRLGKGTMLPSIAVRCLMFDCSHDDFIGMDELVAAIAAEQGGAEDADNEDRGS